MRRRKGGESGGKGSVRKILIFSALGNSKTTSGLLCRLELRGHERLMADKHCGVVFVGQIVRFVRRNVRDCVFVVVILGWQRHFCQ